MTVHFRTPAFTAASRQHWAEICRTRPRPPDEHGRAEAARARTLQKRRQRQRAILGELERTLGLSPTCRDPALLGRVLTLGVYARDLAGYLGCHPNMLTRWVRGTSVARVRQ